MSYFDNSRDFLNTKLLENNLSRQDLARGANIPLPTLSAILNKKRPSVGNKVIDSRPSSLSMQSALSIANYFNCSIDEILGRKEYAPAKERGFKNISIDHAMSTLKEFIANKLEETNLDIYELSKICGFSRTAFAKFTTISNPKGTISTPAALSLADYFKVSLDEIIGRSSSLEKEQAPEVTDLVSTSAAPKFLEDLNEKDLKLIEGIKKANIGQSRAPSREKQSFSETLKPPRAR